MGVRKGQGHNEWYIEWDVKTKTPSARCIGKSSWKNTPIVIDGWTMEWYDEPFQDWKNVFTDKRAWPLEEAFVQMAEEYQNWLKALGGIPNVACMIRLRNLRSGEVIPVEVIA